MLPQLWFVSSVVEFAYLKNGHPQGLGEGREGGWGRVDWPAHVKLSISGEKWEPQGAINK